MVRRSTWNVLNAGKNTLPSSLSRISIWLIKEALPMLKRKAKLNYRRGYTHSNCGECDHFRPNTELVGIGGVTLPPAPRCMVIGLEPGKMYRVHQRNVCDRFDNSQRIRSAMEGV